MHKFDRANLRVHPSLLSTHANEEIQPLSLRISTNSLCAHKVMVLSGMGVSVLPEAMVKDEIASGELTCLLPEDVFTFQMKLICRRDDPLSEPSACFISYFDTSI